MGADVPGAELVFGLICRLLLVVALLGPGKPSVDYLHGTETGTQRLIVDGTSSGAAQRSRPDRRPGDAGSRGPPVRLVAGACR